MPRLAVERDESDMVELKLRIKEEMRAKLAKSAGSRGISLNAEMAMRLGQSFEMEKREQDARDLICQLSKELSEANARASRQHDVLLHLIANGMKLVPLDQPKAREDAA
jgi:hypothetical protein